VTDTASLVLFKRAILVGDRVIFCDRNVSGRPPGIQITGKSLDTRPQRVRITHLLLPLKDTQSKINSFASTLFSLTSVS